jgi:chaperonin cofactor prefoldin
MSEFIGISPEMQEILSNFEERMQRVSEQTMFELRDVKKENKKLHERFDELNIRLNKEFRPALHYYAQHKSKYKK